METLTLPDGLRAFTLTTPAQAAAATALLEGPLRHGGAPLTPGDILLVAPDAEGRYLEAEEDGLKVVGELHGYLCTQ